MKVLFINHPESDFGEAFLHNGLCNLIGAENVYEYPLKHSYHGIDHRYSTSAIEKGYTSPLGWYPAFPYAWSDEERADSALLIETIRRRIKDKFFDLIIVGSLREIALQTYDRFSNEIRHSEIPVVIHEGEDFQTIYSNLIDPLQPKLFLKRELSSERTQSCDWVMLPFPFSFPDTPATIEMATSDMPLEEKYDVTFSCGATWDARRTALLKLAEGGGNPWLGSGTPEGLPDTVHDLMPWDKYVKKMAESKMGISVRGYGWDTCRYWETAYSTLLVHDKLDLVIPNPYTHEENCLVFDDMDHMVKLVKEYNRPERLEDLRAMRMSCHAHTNRYHTNTARVKVIFERLSLNYEE